MRKYLSILLSFVLLASHIHLTIGTHFCGGEWVESGIMVGNTHLGCGMADMDGSCSYEEEHASSGEALNNAPCCKNEYQDFKTTDEFVKENVSFPVEFAVALLFTPLRGELFSETENPSIADYAPPLPEKNIQVLFQSFLL